MRSAQLWLSYFKQGDDLAACLEEAGSLAEALELHALRLDESAKQLRDFRDSLPEAVVNVFADTHVITVDGPDGWVEQQISAGVLQPWGDEEDEEGEEGEDLDGEELDDESV